MHTGIVSILSHGKVADTGVPEVYQHQCLQRTMGVDEHFAQRLPFSLSRDAANSPSAASPRHAPNSRLLRHHDNPMRHMEGQSANRVVESTSCCAHALREGINGTTRRQTTAERTGML